MEVFKEIEKVESDLWGKVLWGKIEWNMSSDFYVKLLKLYVLRSIFIILCYLNKCIFCINN